MNGVRQTWLVSRRELRERIRSRSFWAGTVIMLLVVVAAIVVPAMVEPGKVNRDVGFAGDIPVELPRLVAEQARTVDVTVRVHRYPEEGAGEEAVRDGDVDVLVVDARVLKWRDRPDERLRAVVTGSIQLVAVQERAVAAGINPEQLDALGEPVEVESVQIGIAAGRSPDDQAAAMVMSILLLVAVATYGQLVLTGVVEEKSSRVVEVLLARMPARHLLAGKVTGIGLLGLAQLALTAVVALVATTAVASVDIPAISGDVLAWVVAWFVLGYVIYAMAYGALGSLASRVEDASGIAAPVTTVLIVGYWASLVAVSADPESGWSQLVSILPVTAPLAMPGRIALGTAAWWEPVLAVTLTVAAIAGLIAFAGRVYTGAILHTGPTLGLRDAWGRGTTAAGPAAARRDAVIPMRTTGVVDLPSAGLVGIAVALGAVVLAIAHDVVAGVAVAAAYYAISSRVIKARHRSQ